MSDPITPYRHPRPHDSHATPELGGAQRDGRPPSQQWHTPRTPWQPPLTGCFCFAGALAESVANRQCVPQIAHAHAHLAEMPRDACFTESISCALVHSQFVFTKNG